jgi:hypothetical protein
VYCVAGGDIEPPSEQMKPLNSTETHSYTHIAYAAVGLFDTNYFYTIYFLFALLSSPSFMFLVVSWCVFGNGVLVDCIPPKLEIVDRFGMITSEAALQAYLLCRMNWG